jgi:hypothetical protein
MNTFSISEFLTNTANKLNFKREKYVEKNIPSNFDQITVFFALGDLRSTAAVSTMLLPRIRKEKKALRYFIVFGYPNFSCLYPYADEYWSFNAEEKLDQIYYSSNGLDNYSNLKTIYLRHLNENFREVTKQEDLSNIYDGCLLTPYWENNKNLRVILPQISSSVVSFNEAVQAKFNNLGSKKLFVFPNKNIQIYRKNKLIYQSVSIDFWKSLIQKLLNLGIGLVILKNPLTYDLSEFFSNEDKVFNVAENDLEKIMSLMRLSGCVLDFFSGIGRFAAIARTPYIVADERYRYFKFKEYEYEDVIGKNVPIERIFLFADLINPSNNLFENVANNIINKIDKIMDKLQKNKGLSDAPYSDFLSNYENVRYYQTQKLGVNFIKFPPRAY